MRPRATRLLQGMREHCVVSVPRRTAQAGWGSAAEQLEAHAAHCCQCHDAGRLLV